MASHALKGSNWAARLLTLSRPAYRYSSSTTPLRAARPYNPKLSELSSTISKPASTSATSSGATTPKPAATSSGSASSSSNTTAPPRAASPGDKVNNLSKSGLSDSPFDESREYVNPEHIDWTRSYHGLSAEPFSKEAAQVLLQETAPDDVEIKPDGIVYLPEIKYRRILNKAFGPGGWGLVPRGESIVTPKMVTREYALVAHGRLVSIARGEQDYFSPDGIPTATEGCKSNAMMRCCKDLGVASELWDPRWIRKYKANHAREVFVEHVVNKRKMKIWIRKDDAVGYPFKELKYN